jgi:hypothetical protein
MRRQLTTGTWQWMREDLQRNRDRPGLQRNFLATMVSDESVAATEAKT